MRLRHLTALTAVLFIAATSFAQKNKFALLLKNGTVFPKANISSFTIDSVSRMAHVNNKRFVVIQFEELPSEETKKRLAAAGIQLLNYLPNNAYTATISGNINKLQLQQSKARALYTLSPQQKIQPSLLEQANTGMQEVWISFPKTFSVTEVLTALQQKNIEVSSTQYEAYHILILRIAASRLQELAGLPFIEYVQSAPSEIHPLDNNSRRGSRANVLNAPLTNGGKGLNGEGVVIGIGDIGNATHIDLNSREISNAPVNDKEGHANFTHAVVAGAGIINETYRGYAPKAIVISDLFQNIFIKAPSYVADYNMVITNNSYGSAFNCNDNGSYNMASQVLDQQAFDFPSLEHVFAAGNSGSGNCPPYVAGFKTILGGFQAAKNILCVGNVDDQGNLYYSSSKGPVKDGRLKPDMVADGTAVTSAWLNNTYRTDWGTSISAPGVAGGLALLYQQYRQLHNNNDPKSALMKALICNGADDKGNNGPDYSYGYGNMNLVRSMDMLEKIHYYSGNSTAASADMQTINVPPNTAQLKVLLYWHDPAGSLLSSQALVNDLDLEVTDAANNTILPAVLDTAAAKVAGTATTGADHINNMEQVVINNPAAGHYTIRVKGTAITQNPSQEYVVVYDAIPVSLQLTYPIGGEGLAPGENTKISWDAYGDSSNTFTLQYSLDNGSNWVDINTNISASSRFLSWQVPNSVTDKALVRIVENSTSLSSTSNPFTIVGIPALSLSSTQCEGYINLSWSAVANATDYEVLLLRGGEMVYAGTTTNTSYTFNSLAKDSTYWISVRARANGKPGRRAIAVSRQPNDGNCAGNISDNDLKLNAILSPLSGRKFTSTELSATAPVTVQVKNLDNNPVNNFTVKYSFNNGPWVAENVNHTIAAGDVYAYTFHATVDASAVGEYPLVAVVNNTITDTITANDTLVSVIKQLDNPPLNLATPFLDDLENAAAATYQKDTIGLDGLSRYDFETTSAYGRLRTFINARYAHSGSKAFTLDEDRIDTTIATNNYLTGTFNLSSYKAGLNNIRLDFQYSNRVTVANPNNKVWIRGNDQQPWIEVYDFNTHPSPDSTIYKLSSSIEIADSLVNKGQGFSSSFQVKWGQYAVRPAADNTVPFSMDDIHIYEAFHDMQMLRIDTPVNLSCGLSAAFPLKVAIRNSDNNTLNNVPIRYSVNGAAWVSETIASIAPHTTLPYSFSKMLDLSAPGIYTIRAIVDDPTDNYRPNDTVSITFHNAPLIAAFPYLQNFETGDGGWYTEGSNTSWEYGTPASTKINRAASGTKAWKTRLAGNYNDQELSYLYSPCFTIGGMSQPTLSFSLALDLEDCGSALCDAAWVEYSMDNKTWRRLTDSLNTATNWYNAGKKTLWSIENYTRWHVATAALPQQANTIRFRFVLKSDEAVDKEGIAIDDIHVYDNTNGIYDGTSPIAAVSQTVNADSNWVHFTSSGKLVASVKANNQNLGTTQVQVYADTSKVRFSNNQYYLSRHITIKPANRLTQDSVWVRFYFLDKEAETLINAQGCDSCGKPSSAYQLGVSKYTDADTAVENGTIADNKNGLWSFLTPDQVTKVPFDKGYYAEFKVKNFSEFWLSKGSLSNQVIVPVQLLDFIAQKTNSNDVLLTWKVDGETNVDTYQIEVAKSYNDLQAGRFQMLGAIKSTNAATPQSYAFTDGEVSKTGARYYRLKIVNKDGSFSYSDIRSVLFSDDIKWSIYPNPSNGMFQLVYQINNGETMTVKVMDVTGRTVLQLQLAGDGFVQKQVIDLSGSHFAAGIYLLQTRHTSQLRSFKVYKQ